jgi:hypothetical protein
MSNTLKPSRRGGWAFFFALFPGIALAAEPKVRFATIEHGKHLVVEVAGLSDANLKQLKNAASPEFSAILSVRVAGGSSDLLGTYTLTESALRFESRYPPGAGVTFRATFDPKKMPHHPDGQLVAAEGTVPKPAGGASAVIERIYPSGDKLPENQLRFYIHFSAPMSRRNAYEHLKLLDEHDKPVVGAFLELGEELWDPAGKRFTLLLHPGRVKRGLRPREEAGPILEEGKHYTLVIDAGWPDADGNPLKAGSRKSFSVVAPDETQPDPKKWTIAAPPAGSAKSVMVAVEKPLDHALLQRLLSVVDADGKPVDGTPAVSDGETRWTFTPAKSWAAGRYRLRIDTALEDRAGNSIARPFELDLVQPRPEGAPKLVELEFEIK